MMTNAAYVSHTLKRIQPADTPEESRVYAVISYERSSDRTGQSLPDLGTRCELPEQECEDQYDYISVELTSSSVLKRE